MRMSRQRQREAVRHAGKDVGFMGQKDRRRVVGDLRQRSLQVVKATVAAAPAQQGHLIVEPRQPERSRRGAAADLQRLVLQDRDARVAQEPGDAVRPATARLRRAVVPPVVVAKDRIAPERGGKTRRDTGEIRHWHAVRDKAMPGLVVAQKKDQVRAQRVGPRHDAFEPRQADPGFAHVQIGKDRDLQRSAPPTGRCDPPAPHPEPERGFDEEAVGGNEKARQERSQQALQDCASGQHPASRGVRAGRRRFPSSRAFRGSS